MSRFLGMFKGLIGGTRKRSTKKQKRRRRVQPKSRAHRRKTRCPPRRRRQRAYFKYSRSLTHPGEKDFTRKKGQKKFNRGGKFQTWNSRGRTSTPYAIFS